MTLISLSVNTGLDVTLSFAMLADISIVQTTPSAARAGRERVPMLMRMPMSKGWRVLEIMACNSLRFALRLFYNITRTYAAHTKKPTPAPMPASRLRLHSR